MKGKLLSVFLCAVLSVVTLTGCGSTASNGQNAEQIENYISSGCDVIMVNPSDPNAIESVCAEAEVESLMKVVEKLRSEGVGIVYISHRLDEIFRLSQRITVLRDGEYVTTLVTKESNVNELVTLMVGRELTESYPARANCIEEEEILRIEGLTGNGDKDISFSIRSTVILTSRKASSPQHRRSTRLLT